ncbi:MAG TPA: hypothetical protein VKW77_05145, partial [Acidimicrobiales bacterium]|nr:hypothetical protein [Acidimicrobiales bacterium]
RREMVLPIWAHRRDHHYPKVMMGGVCGNSPQGTCPTGGLCGGDCEDSTIAYHSRVSSYEPFYCGPGMGSTCVDVVTCASKGTFSKGAFAENPPVHTWSYYPPRADITAVNPAVDSPDLALFAQLNDLVAVSQATPPAAKPTDGPVVVPWYPQALNPPLPPGDYVAWIELSQESDWGPGHDLANPDHLNQADSVSTWDFEGHQFLGQPSVVYRVPFHYDALGSTSASSSYVGYSTWDGSDGVIHAPDPNTIYDRPGSGAGRLLDAADGATSYRLEVVVGSCGGPPDMATGPHDGGIGTDGGHLTDGGATPDLAMGIPPCRAPDAATHLAIVPQALGVTVSFDEPTGGVAPMRYAVRYREGTTA